MPYLSSCNIACGGHIGNEDTINHTILLAKKSDVAVGAHPSYPDRENFGRQSIKMNLKDLLENLDAQLDLFLRICTELNENIHHIKPHGALYNDMASDSHFSKEILGHWKQKYGDIKVYLLADSKAITSGLTVGIPAKGEVFIDRAYQNKTALVPRSQPGALVSDKLSMTKKLAAYMHSEILDYKGINHPAQIDTICLHGDHPNADKTAQFIHQYLNSNDVRIAPCR